MLRSRMMWRLFGAYSALLALTLGLLGWVLTKQIEKHLMEELQQSLEMKTVLVRELVGSLARSPAELQELVMRVAEETRTRITLIGADGTVLSDSAEQPEHMENHLDRPEVRQAEVEGIGASTRYSGTVHQSMMYVARRIDSGPVRYVRLAIPLDTVHAEVGWLRQAVWTAAGMALILALMLTLVLARRISAPMAELAAAARSLARGAYGKRVPIATHDEVGTLAAAFNEMSLACATHIHQMEQDRQQLRAVFRSMDEGVLVIDGEQRIQFLNEAGGKFLNLAPTPLPALPSTPTLPRSRGESREGGEGTGGGQRLWELIRHRQLGEAVERSLASDEPFHCEVELLTNDRKVLAVHGSRLPGVPQRGAVLVLHDMTHLRKLERIRQDFVANVSHELKTPLAAIQATAETLLDGAVRDPDHNIGFLESIRENADRLHRLVQDLLTLGRIESGQEVMELQSIPMQEAVETCVARQGHRAEAKELLFETSPPAEPVAVLADEEALAEILDNLVDNAIKYTPSCGKIALRWLAEGEEVVLQIEDTGVGIPEKDLARIFERFYRVDKARSRELGGTGLGLSIVKHLVQAMNGSIAAYSQVGSGSRFEVRLPLAGRPQEAPV